MIIIQKDNKKMKEKKPESPKPETLYEFNEFDNIKLITALAIMSAMFFSYVAGGISLYLYAAAVNGYCK